MLEDGDVARRFIFVMAELIALLREVPDSKERSDLKSLAEFLIRDEPL